MRKVNRAFVPKPEFLSSPEVREHDKLVCAHFRLPEEERWRQRAPDSGKLLFHTDLRQSVSRVFLSKCAYCEIALPESELQVLSHFRPKSNATNARHNKDSPDHYAWFATEWKNLLLLCRECNANQSNLFPVAQERRAMPLSTWAEANKVEIPMLLDPCVDQPGKHFALDRHGIFIPLTRNGEATLDILRLNRSSLQMRRAQAIEWAIAMILSSKRIVKAEWAEAIPHYGAISIFLLGLCKFAINFVLLQRILKHADLSVVAEHLQSVGALRFNKALTEMAASKITPVESLGIIGGGIVTSGAPGSILSADSADAHAISAPARLRSIRVLNFKGIDDLKLNLDDGIALSSEGQNSAMLLGENSTGKSSLLQAIALALMTSSEIKKLRLEPEDFLSRDPGNWRFDRTRALSVKLEFMNEQSCELTYSHEHNRFETKGPVVANLLAYGSRRFFRATRDGIPNKTLFDPMAVLPDPATWLQALNEHEFNAVARAMRSILALQPDDTILRDPDGMALVKAHGRITPVDRMSDGYRSLFAMAIDIMRRMMKVWGNLEFARGIVLIDEIETHLHPRWKLRVMTALRVAMPGVQFIVTTHDPLCLRGMRNGEVHVLYREEDGRVVLRQDLPNIETLRAEQILVSDFFGLFSTADPEQEKLLQELAALAAITEEQLPAHERARRDTLLEQYGGIPTIGVSRDRQILAAAITQHLHQNPTRTLTKEPGMRKESIATIVNMLKRNIEI